LLDPVPDDATPPLPTTERQPLPPVEERATPDAPLTLDLARRLVATVFGPPANVSPVRRTTSPAVEALTMQLETYHPNEFAVGATVGYGHKIANEAGLERLEAMFPGQKTVPRGDVSLLGDDLTSAASLPKFGVRDQLKVDVTQGQWDALVELSFGGDLFDKRTYGPGHIIQAVNAGEDPNAIAELFFEDDLLFTGEGQGGKPTGKPNALSEGLIKRRLHQARTFLTGEIAGDDESIRGLARTIFEERQRGERKAIAPRILQLPAGPPVR
jgi:hypothetical protein